MAGKKRDAVDVAAELSARHDEISAEIEAERAAAAAAFGFTRRAFVYVLGAAYDMAADDIADGFKGDRGQCLNLLFAHLQASFSGLASFPLAEGSVADSDFDVDDPENPDV